MSSRHGRTGLLGRHRECETLDALLTSVRAGQSRVLVVRGEAGVGKSALLDYLAANAAGCRVERAAGVEAEVELAFAGVHQLCAPMLDRLSHLPPPQREALGTAFGLSVGNAPDRFLVGLAVLGLLAEVAEGRPLLCLVDDAQWMDRTSAQILAFVARRLLAERVALVFAVRDSSDEQELRGLPTLLLDGLSDEDARALFDGALPGRLDERVRDRIVAESRGNPLALLELPRGSSAAELAGGFALPDAARLVSHIEQSFLRRIEALPAVTQQLLLVAAAESVGDVTLLWRATEQLGLGFDAAGPAIEAGLVELDGRVRFRHPLVRSAAYRAAAPAVRRAVHRALAEATDPEAAPDRRAWHRAHAAAGPDETVAGELERSADRARGRGGLAASAAFLRRATEVTPDPARRAARAAAAAQAAFDAGAPDAAEELLAVGEIGALDNLQRAQLARLRAQIVFARRRGSDAPPLLLDAARRLEPLDAALARETYLEALAAAIFASRLGTVGVPVVAEAARTAPPGRGPLRLLELLLDAVSTRFTEGYAAAIIPMRRTMEAFRREAGRDGEDVTRWLWLAWLVAGELWEDEAWAELAAHAVRRAREAGALTVLPVALQYLAAVQVHAGEFGGAAALIEEADDITAATGNARVGYTSLVLAAWRGDEAETLERIEFGLRDAIGRGEGRVVGLVGYVTAVLNCGLGRYDAALAGAREACEHDDPVLCGWSLVELVEAAVRSGARDAASAALQRLTERTRAAGTDWALGSEARSRALLSDGEAAEDLYQEAIARLERSRITVHLARAHLVYGEWLRRENRRVDARAQLRVAHEMLGGIGASAFAERARRELSATGETVRQRTVEAREALTAQESQVARLAAEGRTNPEIGSQLFISPRTAEYHLHKVFAKLGISSRRELRRALRNRPPGAPPAEAMEHQ